MAENIYDGNLYVYYLPACADTAEPTTTELAAGTKVSSQMRVEDLDTPFTDNSFDNSNAESEFQAEGVGTFSAGLSLTLDDNDDKVLFDLFARRLTGFILISRHGLPVATDVVEVYPVECHGSKPVAPASNEKVKFIVQFAVTSAPVLDAVLTAP